jgi:hypothetical protein
MSDVDSLLLVVAVVYVTECASWVRRGGVGFRRLWTREWQLWHPVGVLGNARGAILVGNPLPPLEPAFISYQIALSASPEAIYSYTAASINPGWRAPQPARFVPLEEIRLVNTAQKRVLVNDSLFLHATSVPAALGWRSLIESLCACPLEQRASFLNRSIDARFDLKSIQARRDLFRQHSKSLRVLSHLLFVFLFGAAFPVIAIYGLGATWIPLLTALLAHTVPISILFLRAHRKLYPAADEERFTRFLTMLLAPPTAIRAADLLGRNLLESFHPLAVAQVLCGPGQFRQFGRDVLRDLRHPFGAPVEAANTTPATQTEEFFRKLVTKRVEALLESAGIHAAQLLEAPAKSDPSHRSYCPRCGAQFVNIEGHCHDCGGVPLESFPSDAGPQADRRQAVGLPA